MFGVAKARLRKTEAGVTLVAIDHIPEDTPEGALIRTLSAEDLYGMVELFEHAIAAMEDQGLEGHRRALAAQLHLYGYQDRAIAGFDEFRSLAGLPPLDTVRLRQKVSNDLRHVRVLVHKLEEPDDSGIEVLGPGRSGPVNRAARKKTRSEK